MPHEPGHRHPSSRGTGLRRASFVEWEDLEFGVVNCNGELLASGDRCSHDDGHLLDIDCDAGAVECSRDGSVFVLRAGMPKNLLAYVPSDIFPVSVEDRVINVEVD